LLSACCMYWFAPSALISTYHFPGAMPQA